MLKRNPGFSYDHPYASENDIEELIIKDSKDNLDLALLKQARYISDRSLGTIDVLSILRSVYEQGKANAI